MIETWLVERVCAAWSPRYVTDGDGTTDAAKDARRFPNKAAAVKEAERIGAARAVFARIYTDPPRAALTVDGEADSAAA